MTDPATDFDVLDEEMLTKLLKKADPDAVRYEHIVAVRLSAVLAVMRFLLNGQMRGQVTLVDEPPL